MWVFMLYGGSAETGKFLAVCECEETAREYARFLSGEALPDHEWRRPETYRTYIRAGSKPFEHVFTIKQELMLRLVATPVPMDGGV